MAGSPADPGGADHSLGDVVSAVAFSAVSRSLAASLAPLGIPAMVLKGPPLQARLFGSDTSYRSQDVDLLVPRRHGRTVRRLLRGQGWLFSPANGVLWRLDRAAAFARDGVVVDLHWGLHASLLSARRLVPLERAMWEGAPRSSAGWFEPRIEPLVVYLAVHTAGRGFEKPEQVRALAAAVALVRDWGEVEAVARAAGVSGVVRHAVAVSRGDAAPGDAPGLNRRLDRARQRAVSVARTGAASKAVASVVRRLRRGRPSRP